MNYLDKLVQRQINLLAAIGLTVIVAAVTFLVAWSIFEIVWHIPTAWWLPVEQRPFGGKL